LYYNIIKITRKGAPELKPEPNKPRKLEYKWIIVALCFLMVFTCLGFCSSPKSLYITAITEALDIKRSAFSIGDSCRYITTSIVNIFFGFLVGKFGTKKLIGAGFLCLISSCLLYSFSPNLIGFYIAGALLGMGLSWTTTTMVGAVVNKWCKESKGTIMGAVLAANGLGGALATQIVSPIIYNESNAFGYRNAYRLTALILFIVGAIIMIFFRENPKGKENTPTVVSKKKGRGQGWVGIEFEIAKTKMYFYGAAVCIFLTGMVLQGITGIAAAHMKDVGLDPGYVALVISCHSLALAGFKFLTGFIYDRVGLRITMNICSITGVIVMFMLAMITKTTFGMILAMIYGIFSSLALPLETIMLPIYASDLFGEKSFNKILGIFVSVNTAGYAVGTPLINWGFDISGSYRTMLIVFGSIMIVTVIALQFVITAADKQRKIILEREAQLEANNSQAAIK